MSGAPSSEWPRDANGYPEDFGVPSCDHGCGRDALIQHADERLLCRACYEAEVSASAGNPPCPTCYPERS